MPTFLADARYGARSLVKRPGFASVAILLLALGIGANITIYSWVETFLVQPLRGAAHADAVVVVHGTTLTRRDISLSYPNYADTRDRLPASVAGLAAFRVIALNVQASGEAERAWGELVTANLFSVLGVSPLHGRLLVPDDDRAPGASPVVVLSHAYWQRRFHGDPAVVGRTVAINGTPFTIVGVAPPGFRGATTGMKLDVWVPMMMQRAVYAGDRLTARGNAWLNVYARLAPASDLEMASRDLSRVAAQLSEEHPEVNKDRGVALYPLWRDPQSAAAVVGPVLGVLIAVTAVILLVVCANIASLLLARGSARRREIAVRIALGASRTRIVRQLLTESVLLAGAGAGAGLLVAGFLNPALAALVPSTPLPIDAEISVTSLGPLIGLVLALGTTLAFGLAPALQSSRPDLVPTLKEARGLTGGARRRLRTTLVVGQVALSVLLLVAAGLFLRTFQNATRADVGFDLEHGLLASIDLLPAGYDEARGLAFYRDLVESLAAVPGVSSAALARDIPLTLGGGASDTTVAIEGYVPSEGEEITIFYDRASSDFFRTMGIPVLAGRAFTPQDAASDADVIVINRTMAERYWRDGEAVGRRVTVGSWTPTVVGIVADVTYRSVGSPVQPYMYLPLHSAYRSDMTLVVRTNGEPGRVLDGVRSALAARDPSVPLFDVRTMAAHREMGAFLPRVAAVVLGLLGGVALVLASVGLYGLLAFVVAERTPEIGVRLALGAERREIVRLVVGQGLGLAVVGGAIGLALSALLLPLAASQLVGVTARDGLTYAAAAVILLVGTTLASWLPARRAATVDPLKALRYE